MHSGFLPSPPSLILILWAFCTELTLCAYALAHVCTTALYWMLTCTPLVSHLLNLHYRLQTNPAASHLLCSPPGPVLSIAFICGGVRGRVQRNTMWVICIGWQALLPRRSLSFLLSPLVYIDFNSIQRIWMETLGAQHGWGIEESHSFNLRPKGEVWSRI